MTSESLFPAAHLWFLAEGTEREKPSLYRGRQIPDQLIGNTALPSLLVIGRPFDVTDSTGLPNAAQYQELKAFESNYLDHIESARIGIIAFVKTYDGLVQYFTYVSSVDLAMNAMGSRIAEELRLELSVRDDPHWTEYRSFLRGQARS